MTTWHVQARWMTSPPPTPPGTTWRPWTGNTSFHLALFCAQQQQTQHNLYESLHVLGSCTQSVDKIRLAFTFIFFPIWSFIHSKSNFVMSNDWPPPMRKWWFIAWFTDDTIFKASTRSTTIRPIYVICANWTALHSYCCSIVSGSRIAAKQYKLLKEKTLIITQKGTMTIKRKKG